MTPTLALPLAPVLPTWPCSLRRAVGILIAFAALMVDGATAIVTNRVLGAGTEPHFLGWGTGAGTSAHDDTTLFTEDSGGSPAYARAVATPTRVTVSLTNDAVRWVGTLTSNGTKTITNVGLFDALTVGNLFAKGGRGRGLAERERLDPVHDHAPPTSFHGAGTSRRGSRPGRRSNR